MRVGSGFFANEFLEELERQALPYPIAARMNPLRRRAVSEIHQWQSFAPGLEVGETAYCTDGWHAPRRLVVRELLCEQPVARRPILLEVQGYAFYAPVPALSLDLVHTCVSTTAAPRARTHR